MQQSPWASQKIQGVGFWRPVGPSPIPAQQAVAQSSVVPSLAVQVSRPCRRAAPRAMFYSQKGEAPVIPTTERPAQPFPKSRALQAATLTVLGITGESEQSTLFRILIVDLLFFHIEQSRYVVIELKTGKFSPSTPTSSTSTSPSSTMCFGAGTITKPSGSLSAAAQTTTACGTVWDAPPHPWQSPPRPTTSSHRRYSKHSPTKGPSSQRWNGPNPTRTTIPPEEMPNARSHIKAASRPC